jgi:glycosyltransferase involved in cell wall biosynthesis
MKIVIAIDSYNDANGGTIATKRLINELRQRGHEVRIISAIHENPSDPHFFKIPGFVAPGTAESLENMNFLFGKNDKKVFREAIRGADFVQVQFPFLMAKGVVKVAKKLGVPVVGAFHVQPQNIMAALGKTSKLLERFLWLSFKYLLFKRVDDITCPSVFSAKLLKSEGVKAQLWPISNGIPVEYVRGDYHRPEWFKDHFVILNIGRHADEKRQSLIIEGVKRSKYKHNIKLMLVGRGERSEILREKGKELPIEPFIEFVSHEDKLRYLNTADMYVHASIVELESLSCLEAVGCGLPVLVSDSKYSAASMFALDDNFLFTSDDPDSLAAKLDYWYENKDIVRSEAMKKRMLDEAEKYRFERAVNQYEAFVKEVVSRQKGDYSEVFEEDEVISYTTY